MVGHEFPYSNLHDLNIDWILKIVKDFQTKYDHVDEVFQTTLQQIEEAGENAIQAITENKDTALESIGVFLQQCIQAIDTKTNEGVTAIDDEKTAQQQLLIETGNNARTMVANEGILQTNRISGLIATLPDTYEDSLNQLQIINATLNGTYNYPPLVQGHYADSQATDSKTLVADNYRVSTLISAGCASKRIRIQVTNVNGIIRDIIYWTGWGDSAIAHEVPVSTGSGLNQQKTLYTYTFPSNATYFTIVFAYDYDMTQTIAVSDLEVSLQWLFNQLENITINEHGFDASNANALEFVIPGNTNVSIEEGNEIDEIDVAGGTKTVATSHKLKDSTARESVDELKSALAQNVSFTDASYIKHADGTVGGNYDSTKASEFIAVIPGEMFNLSGYVGSETISSIIGLAFYDKNKTYVSGIQYDGNNISVVVPSTALFIRFTVYTSCINSYAVNIGLIRPNHDFTLLKEVEFSNDEKETGLNNLGALPRYEIIDGITFETGKYININGTVTDIAYASLSDYIDAAFIENVYACLSAFIPISFFTKDKTWISNYYSETFPSYLDAVPKKYSIIIPANCKYIRISNITTALNNSDVYVEKGHGYMSKITDESISMISGKYVSTLSSGTVQSVAYGELSDFINTKGLLAFYASLSGVLSICYYDADKNYISGVNGTTGEAPSWRDVNPPQNAEYARISNDTRYNTQGVKIRVNIVEKITGVAYKTDILNLQNQLDNIDVPRNILTMYDNINCIGDSLTWSQVYYSDNGQRQAYKTYPAILASLCGVTSHLFATPGDSAILWWERSSTGAFDNHGLYIVFLGTNAGFTDTIATDCVGTDPAQFAETQTGQYGRILQTITNNGDKAVLVLPYVGGGGTAELLAVTRDVINQFGTKYNFPVINLDNPAGTNAYYHYYPDKSGQNTVHFNDLGYAWVANEICQQINKLPIADQWNISRTQ